MKPFYSRMPIDKTDGDTPQNDSISLYVDDKGYVMIGSFQLPEKTARITAFLSDSNVSSLEDSFANIVKIAMLHGVVEEVFPVLRNLMQQFDQFAAVKRVPVTDGVPSVE